MLSGADAFIVPLARTAIVLAVLFAGLRLLGRRHTGEINTDDILLVLLLANSVQNAMTTGSGSLVVALVSSGTLIGMGWLAGFVFRRSPAAERRVGGAPVVLVHDGRVVHRNLRREHVSDDELMAQVRKQGLASASDVKLAVLEPNGSFSVVKREETGE